MKRKQMTQRAHCASIFGEINSGNYQEWQHEKLLWSGGSPRFSRLLPCLWFKWKAADFQWAPLKRWVDFSRFIELCQNIMNAHFLGLSNCSTVRLIWLINRKMKMSVFYTGRKFLPRVLEEVGVKSQWSRTCEEATPWPVGHSTTGLLIDVTNRLHSNSHLCSM